MAPSKASGASKGQKTIQSFFTSAGAKSSTSTKPKAEKPPVTNGNASKKRVEEPKTPESRLPSSQSLPRSASSYDGSSAYDTPPTSDALDVDMDSADEKKVVKPKAFGKRKVVLDDSDEESMVVTSSSRKSETRYKKARLSEPLSDDDDGHESTVSSFSSRLTGFKNTKKKSRARSSDDDDFTAASDSDSDVRSGKSGSLSSRSCASSDNDDFSDASDSDAPRKTSKMKPSRKSSGRTDKGGSNNFLTAAERREHGKRTEKKSQEDPFAFLQDIQDKDGKRPGDPLYDSRTLLIPKGAWKNFTPFEKQFWEIKQNHFDTVLFFQKGKFFELYEDDARIGHQEFDLKLTSRVKMSMVGVPEGSFEFWAAKFLAKGYKVGKVGQSETALGSEMRRAKEETKTKGEKIVNRELHKVYTTGTLVDGQMLTEDEAGHCISIRETYSSGENQDSFRDGSICRFGISVLDCSTSQFDLSAFEDDICRTKLETLLRQVRPKEVIYTKGTLSVTTTRLLKTTLPPSCIWTPLREVEGFDYDRTLIELKNIYNDSDAPAPDSQDSMDDEGVSSDVLPSYVPSSIRRMAHSHEALESLGSMIWYLRQLNIDKDIMTMRNFNVYDPMKKGLGMVLDGQTLAHVEVLSNSEGSDDGTLLKLLGRCVTPFGKRLFRIWLCMPLREVSAINARLDAVEDLMAHQTFDTEFREIAKGLPDLERIVSRIHAKNCRVKDFIKVLNAFKQLSRGLSKLADDSESFNSKTVLGLLRGAPDLLPHVRNVESMFKKPPADSNDDELLPQDGKDKEYDEIVDKIKRLERTLEKELQKLEDDLGLDLVYWHSAVGTKEVYLVETSASNAKKVPDNWKSESKTKSKTRFRVPSLQQHVRNLQEARETRTTVIKNFKLKVFVEFSADRSIWLRAIRVFAELDCLLSLAKASSALGETCRPEFVEGDEAFIEFEELRHPVLDLSLGSFVPNDVKMGSEHGKVVLLTGPNMAGKSTLMRMTATGIIMAQLGMMVPASKARLCPVDSILTRMGAYDNMFSNASTFKVELDECCKILRDATPKSLVIMDELGRGTSTFDGMAIAGAVLHELATHTLSLSFFATHYASLTDDFARHPNITNMHMETMVDEDKRDIVFLFKLIKGAATSSFGTHVANLAGVPYEVVERADLISKDFAKQFQERLVAKKKNDAAAHLPLHIQADFVYLHRLAKSDNSLPEDPLRKKEVLRRLKTAIRSAI